jgi:FPC/CPF motif-containing protein YcgG
VADPATAGEAELIEALHAMIGHPDFPCLAARSVFRHDRATVRVYGGVCRPIDYQVTRG